MRYTLFHLQEFTQRKTKGQLNIRCKIILSVCVALCNYFLCRQLVLGLSSMSSFIFCCLNNVFVMPKLCCRLFLKSQNLTFVVYAMTSNRRLQEIITKEIKYKKSPFHLQFIDRASEVSTLCKTINAQCENAQKRHKVLLPTTFLFFLRTLF